MLGTLDDYGSKLGLSKTWGIDAIKAGGNYAEIFNRYIGPDTPIALARGLNALPRDGGLLYAAPLR